MPHIYDGASRPRAPKLKPKLPAADKKKIALERKGRVEEFEGEMLTLFQDLNEQLVELAKEYGHSREHVAMRLGQMGPELSKTRSANARNGWLSAKAIEVNGALPEGASKQTMIEISTTYADEYKGLTDAEKEQYRDKLTASRTVLHPTRRKTQKAAAADVAATLQSITGQATRLQIRTGHQLTIFATKTSTESNILPFVWMTPSVNGFTDTVLKTDPYSLARKLEGWAVHGGEGAALQGRKLHLAMKNEVSRRLTRSLVAASGVEDITVNYKHFFEKTEARHSVELAGWPKGEEVKAASYLNRDILKAVHAGLVAEPPRIFFRLVSDETIAANRRKLALQESGVVVGLGNGEPEVGLQVPDTAVLGQSVEDPDDHGMDATDATEGTSGQGGALRSTLEITTGEPRATNRAQQPVLTTMAKDVPPTVLQGPIGSAASVATPSSRNSASSDFPNHYPPLLVIPDVRGQIASSASAATLTTADAPPTVLQAPMANALSVTTPPSCSPASSDFPNYPRPLPVILNVRGQTPSSAPATTIATVNTHTLSGLGLSDARAPAPVPTSPIINTARNAPEIVALGIDISANIATAVDVAGPVAPGVAATGRKQGSDRKSERAGLENTAMPLVTVDQSGEVAKVSGRPSRVIRPTAKAAAAAQSMDAAVPEGAGSKGKPRTKGSAKGKRANDGNNEGEQPPLKRRRPLQGNMDV